MGEFVAIRGRESSHQNNLPTQAAWWMEGRIIYNFWYKWNKYQVNWHPLSICLRVCVSVGINCHQWSHLPLWRFHFDNFNSKWARKRGPSCTEEPGEGFSFASCPILLVTRVSNVPCILFGPGEPGKCVIATYTWPHFEREKVKWKSHEQRKAFTFAGFFNSLA